MGATKIQHVKIKYAYTYYIAEMSSDEVFLTWKFKKPIIFTMKISRSMVSSMYRLTTKLWNKTCFATCMDVIALELISAV